MYASIDPDITHKPEITEYSKQILREGDFGDWLL